MPKVQITYDLSAFDGNLAIYSYAYDTNYISSMVLSREIFDMLGRPETLYGKLEAGNA